MHLSATNRQSITTCLVRRLERESEEALYVWARAKRDVYRDMDAVHQLARKLARCARLSEEIKGRVGQ